MWRERVIQAGHKYKDPSIKMRRKVSGQGLDDGRTCRPWQRVCILGGKRGQQNTKSKGSTWYNLYFLKISLLLFGEKTAGAGGGGKKDNKTTIGGYYSYPGGLDSLVQYIYWQWEYWEVATEL